MTEATAPAPAGLFARVIGIITAPRTTYERVVAHPQPFLVLFLVAIVTGLAASLPQFDARVRQATVDMQAEQIERFTGRPVTPEMYAQMERQAASPIAPAFAIVGTLIFLPIMALVITAVLWAVFNAILGGTASFKHVLAVVTHSQVIAGLGAAVAAPIQMLQGSMSPGGPFHLGVLVPMLAEGSVIRSFLSFTNVFTIWGFIVLAIGLSVLYRRKTGGIAIGLLAGYTAIGLGLASLFGGLMGMAR